jgi:hypothetical protein
MLTVSGAITRKPRTTLSLEALLGAPQTAMLLSGKTLTVDQVNGVNETALRGVSTKPFLTLAAARDAAQSGDVINVGPGTYNENDLARDGVHWRGKGGANIIYTGSSATGIFDDKGAAISMTVDGFDTIEYNGTGSGSTCGAVRTSHPSSNFNLQAKIFRSRNVLFAVFWQVDGTLVANASDLFDDASGGSSQGCVYWQNGNGRFSAPTMQSTGYVVIYSECTTTPTGDLYVSAENYLLNPGGTGYAVFYATDTQPTAVCWISGKLMMNTNTTGTNHRTILVTSGVGKYYFSGFQKISNLAAGASSYVIEIGGNVAGFWCTTQKLTSSGGRFLTNSGAGKIRLSVQEFESLATVATGIQNTGASDLIISANGAKLTATIGISASAGTVTVNDVSFNSTTDLFQSGTGVIKVLIAAGSGAGGALIVSGTISLVGKAALGLGSVDNTADTAKPVSSAQAAADAVVFAAAAAALATHTGNTSNPHSVTKSQVGLGSADNTADTAKPVSTAQQTALDLKAAISSLDPSAFLGSPILLSVKNVTLRTTGAPADIATITIPAWITRWALTGLANTTSLNAIFCETGDSTAALSAAYTAAAGAGVLMFTAVEVGVAPAAVKWVPSSSQSKFYTTASHGNIIYIRQTVNSTLAATCSYYVFLVPYL